MTPPEDHGRCALCRIYTHREITTTLHYEDDDVIVVDCDTCLVPMAVAKTHGIPVPDPVEQGMHTRLVEVADRVLGEGRYHITTVEMQIFDHRHFHARRRWR